MSEEKLPEQRLVINRPLIMDRAMQEAAKRAQCQPKIVSITTKDRKNKK